MTGVGCRDKDYTPLMRVLRNILCVQYSKQQVISMSVTANYFIKLESRKSHGIIVEDLKEYCHGLRLTGSLALYPEMTISGFSDSK